LIALFSADYTFYGVPADYTDNVPGGLKGRGVVDPARATQGPQRSEERSEPRRVDRAEGFLHHVGDEVLSIS
jgi:hypothetical protein